jgi:hypothetical protein
MAHTVPKRASAAIGTVRICTEYEGEVVPRNKRKNVIVSPDHRRLYIQPPVGAAASLNRPPRRLLQKIRKKYLVPFVDLGMYIGSTPKEDARRQQ